MVVFKRFLVGIFLLITLLGCSWALFHPGMFRIHDFTHAARIAELLRALQDGHFPVRWSSNFGFGYGMPLFEFYAPLPFYTGALFYWLGLNLVLTVKLLFLLSSIFTFIGMYQLGSRLFGRAGGVLSAVAVTLAPYRAVNLFVRGALGEAWGMMAIPWVLLGIVQMIRGERKGWLTLTLALLGLFLSHNITSLLFLPISLIFAFGYWWVERTRYQAVWKAQHQQLVEDRQVLRSVKDIFKILPFYLGLIYLLAIGLAAFYLFPAFLEKDFTKVNAIFEGYFHYSNHFLYFRQLFTPYWGYGGSQPGPQDGLSFFLGYGQLIGGVLAMWLFIKLLFKRYQHLKTQKISFTLKGIFKWQVCLFLLLGLEVVLAIFMTSAKSQWIWDHLPFMVAVQFPWRWLSIVATFLGLLAGSATLFISSRFHRYLYVVGLSIVILFTTTTYFQPENFDDVSQSFYYSDPARIRHDMSRTLNDYIPVQMQLIPLSKEIEPIDVPYKVVSGDLTKVKLVIDHTQEKLLETEFSEPAKIEFAIADFPGWVVLLDNQKIPTQRTELGNILVNVPAGNHQLGVQFQTTPIRHWSDSVSLISWVVLIAVIIYFDKKKSTPVII